MESIERSISGSEWRPRRPEDVSALGVANGSMNRIFGLRTRSFVPLMAPVAGFGKENREHKHVIESA